MTTVVTWGTGVGGGGGGGGGGASIKDSVAEKGERKITQPPFPPLSLAFGHSGVRPTEIY